MTNELEQSTPIPSELYITKNGKTFTGDICRVRRGTPPILQEKTVTENGEVTADEGYEGLSKVNVDVPTFITVATEEEAIDTEAYPIVEGQVIVVVGA